MAKITRQTHKIFGKAGSSSDFAQFGSLVFGTPFLTKDIASIQALSAWDNGFQDEVFASNKAPLLEDWNAWAYEHSYQIASLFQDGISDWDSGTTYYKGSFCQGVDGSGNSTGQIFKSLIDNNVGNAPPASASNANWLWVNPPQDLVGAAATLNTIPKVTNTAPANGVPGSVALSDSQISEDGTNVKIGLPLKFPNGSVQATSAAPLTTRNVFTSGGARNFNTSYTNAGGTPRFVSVWTVPLNSDGTPASIEAIINSVKVDFDSIETEIESTTSPTLKPLKVSFWVFPGETYAVNQISGPAVAFGGWVEYQ